MYLVHRRPSHPAQPLGHSLQRSISPSRRCLGAGVQSELVDHGADETGKGFDFVSFSFSHFSFLGSPTGLND